MKKILLILLVLLALYFIFYNSNIFSGFFSDPNRQTVSSSQRVPEGLNNSYFRNDIQRNRENFIANDLDINSMNSYVKQIQYPNTSISANSSNSYNSESPNNPNTDVKNT